MALAKRILLVEDHEDSAKTLARILNTQGDAVTIAGTLSEARAAAAAQPFDVMICDIGLPDGDGSDLMREFTGKYTVEVNVLALEKKEGGSLIAEVTPGGAKAFNFKLVGGPPDDKGLDFSQ